MKHLPRKTRAHPTGPFNNSAVGDIATFLVASTGFLEVSLVGRVFATDALLLLGLPYLIIRRGRLLAARQPRTILFLGVLWLLSQVLTDIVMQSAQQDYLRGWANIIFFIADYTSVFLLLRTNRRISLYAAGLAAGMVLKYLVNPDPEMSSDTWKWGLGVPCTLALVLLANRAYVGGRQKAAAAVLIGACAINLAFNYRSMALIAFITGCCTLTASIRYSRVSPTKAAFAVVLLACCSWGFQLVYSFGASGGFLGSRALKKYQDQSSGDLGVLLGGRNEAFASIRAIIDSPVLGHGSWAKDARYTDLLYAELSGRGYKVYRGGDDLIPSHSHVLGSWVYAGAAGGVFWVQIMVITIRALKSVFVYPLPMRVVTFFCGSLAIWDILFSPFGAQRRFTTPLYIVLSILASERATELQRSMLNSLAKARTPSYERLLPRSVSDRTWKPMRGRLRPRHLSI